MTYRNELFYVKGETEPFTGKAFELYENGQKKWEQEFLRGKFHGQWFSWHENGTKAWEGAYKDGEKDGKWIWWDENGEKGIEEEF